MRRANATSRLNRTGRKKKQLPMGFKLRYFGLKYKSNHTSQLNTFGTSYQVFFYITFDYFQNRMHSNIFCSYTKIELEIFWKTLASFKNAQIYLNLLFPLVRKSEFFSGQCVSGQNFKPIVQKSNPSLVAEDSMVSGFFPHIISFEHLRILTQW